MQTAFLVSELYLLKRSVISVNSMPWQARGKKGEKKGENGKSRNKGLADDDPLRL